MIAVQPGRVTRFEGREVARRIVMRRATSGLQRLPLQMRVRVKMRRVGTAQAAQRHLTQPQVSDATLMLT
jgi:hypothetical protein